MQETRVQSLGEDPLEKGMAIHSFSCLENSMHRAAWQAIVLISLIFSSLYKSYYSSARWDLNEKQAASQASDFTEAAEWKDLSPV